MQTSVYLQLAGRSVQVYYNLFINPHEACPAVYAFGAGHSWFCGGRRVNLSEIVNKKKITYFLVVT